MKRVNHLNSEIKRVNDELIGLTVFTLSKDSAIQRLKEYKKYLFNEIEKLAKEED